MAMTAAVLVLLVAAPEALGAQVHDVGGTSGWTLGVVDYANWAAHESFFVGDTLVFTYGSQHNVAIVTPSAYTSCNTSSPISSYSGGSATIKLNSTGTMYFMCLTPHHCLAGMQFSITVKAATPGPSASPISTTTSSPPPISSFAVTSRNFGAQKYLFFEFSLLMVALIGFMG